MELGAGYLESVYETALTVELDRMGLRYERQKVVPIRFRDRIVGEHRLDLVVEGEVVVEKKAVLSLGSSPANPRALPGHRSGLRVAAAPALV